MKKIISKISEKSKKIFDSIKAFFKKIFNKNDKQNKPTKLTETELLASTTVTKVISPPSLGSKTQFWYGRVNYWADSGTLQKKEVEYMKKVGLTGYIIEMAGWGSSDMRQSANSAKYKNWVKRIQTYYNHLHKLCKQNGLWLFVCIVNDNALSSKHGNKAVDQKHYYSNVAKDLLNIILDDGPENVIVQPISELYPSRVKNHPGSAFQKNAIGKLKSKKFLTCNNDGYGRPSGFGGCNYMAWHPDKISHLPAKATKSKTFIVSDTGGIISELNGGTNCDKTDANCKPSKIKEWRKKVNGYAVCGYYDFKRKSYNEAAIKAMAGK